jgi:hypothetical protein
MVQDKGRGGLSKEVSCVLQPGSTGSWKSDGFHRAYISGIDSINQTVGWLISTSDMTLGNSNTIDGMS